MTWIVYRRGKLTGRMRRLKNPIGILGVSDCLAPPFDLEVAGCLFKEWWPRETVHVEFGFHGHSCD